MNKRNCLRCYSIPQNIGCCNRRNTSNIQMKTNIMHCIPLIRYRSCNEIYCRNNDSDAYRYYVMCKEYHDFQSDHGVKPIHSDGEQEYNVHLSHRPKRSNFSSGKVNHQVIHIGTDEERIKLRNNILESGLSKSIPVLCNHEKHFMTINHKVQKKIPQKLDIYNTNEYKNEEKLCDEFLRRDMSNTNLTERLGDCEREKRCLLEDLIQKSEIIEKLSMQIKEIEENSLV